MSISPKRLHLLGPGTGILLLAALVVLAGCGSQTSGRTQPTATTVVTTATSTHPAGAVVTTTITGITMFSATMGWGSVPTSTPAIDSGIASTTDGGHTWHNVTPSGLTLVSPFTIALYPRSATEAWTWLSRYGGGSTTTLWHTTDGGAHWSTSTVPTGAVGQLDFVDSLHGWLTATPFGAAAGEFPIDVWRTTDGGATWSQVASYPVVAGTTGLSFANATTGFAGGCPLGGSIGGPLNLCVTQDAGGSWAALTSPIPPGYVPGGHLIVGALGLPVFTSATAGVLEVTALSSPSGPVTLYLYRTTDGGTSWQPGPTLGGTANTSVPVNSFPSSVLSTGEVFVAPTVSRQVTLYQLPLGATSWSKIITSGSSLSLLSGLTQVDFVNPMTGWAVTTAGLIGTADGGVTWTVLHT
ncbi:MAG: hypothetical protein ACLQUY_01530 [Ktedonobacterales bacterium]